MIGHRFATAEHPVLPPERARVFFDGVFSTPRLQHPEGVAIGPDGWIWCGSENGEIMTGLRRLLQQHARIVLAGAGKEAGE